MVNARVALLAYVAHAGIVALADVLFADLVFLELGRENVGRCREYRLAPQRRSMTSGRETWPDA